ncbi:MAG: 3-isopropylmalate dehydrogenase [Planctomycetes bacterium]|nr:3-isopropylmalate dehydrogenase [Planctomycetota bacterium]
MKKKILCLAGDGIGPEIMNVTTPIVEKVCAKFGHEVEFTDGLIGYAAYDKYEDTMPEKTWEQIRDCEGVLFGAVGLPDRDAQLKPEMRPEKRALLPMRKEMGLSINIRPIRVYEGLEELSPLREHLAKGVNLTFLRELNSGIYFGKHHTDPGGAFASDECYYAKEEIERIASFGFELARQTGQVLTSIDKANVLDSIGAFWRSTVSSLHEKSYSDVELQHCLVDAFNLYLFTKPSAYQIVLTGNMFGDILSDGAAGLAGSLGLLPSASINPETGFCLYEPSGGSAPDIAGEDKANPIAMILSAALLFRHTYKDEAAACAIEAAVQSVLGSGVRTGDLVMGSGPQEGQEIVGTTGMAEAILKCL